MSLSFIDCKLFFYTDKRVVRSSAIAELLVLKDLSMLFVDCVANVHGAPIQNNPLENCVFSNGTKDFGQTTFRYELECIHNASCKHYRNSWYGSTDTL